MISVLIFSGIGQESELLRELFKDAAAMSGNDSWQFDIYDEAEKVCAFIENTSRIDIVCIDVTDVSGVELAQQIRLLFGYALIILISDIRQSPLMYIKPSISANSLLIRPYDKDIAGGVIIEAVNHYLKKTETGSNDDSFVFENKNGKQIIPYDRIYYFESRDKKIIVGTKHEEFSFYGTLDELQESLPDDFIRCHRSFIVAVKKISLIKLSRHMLTLDNGFIIPVSRTYSKYLKEIYV